MTASFRQALDLQDQEFDRLLYSISQSVRAISKNNHDDVARFSYNSAILDLQILWQARAEYLLNPHRDWIKLHNEVAASMLEEAAKRI